MKKIYILMALHLIFLPQLSCLRILYQCRGIKGHVVLLPLISCSVLEVGSWNRIYSLPSVHVVWSPSKKSFTISGWSSCCLYLAFVQSSTHAWISSDCGDMDERLGSKIFPPALNSCSTATVEIGVPRICLAIIAKIGYSCCWLFHQSRISNFSLKMYVCLPNIGQAQRQLRMKIMLVIFWIFGKTIDPLNPLIQILRKNYYYHHHHHHHQIWVGVGNPARSKSDHIF